MTIIVRVMLKYIIRSLKKYFAQPVESLLPDVPCTFLGLSAPLPKFHLRPCLRHVVCALRNPLAVQETGLYLDANEGGFHVSGQSGWGKNGVQRKQIISGAETSISLLPACQWRHAEDGLGMKMGAGSQQWWKWEVFCAG